MFRRFQSGFLELERHTVKEDLVRLDLSSWSDWLKELGKETLAWALELFRKGTFPQNDYAEFLNWVIWHLGGETKSFWPLKMLGPDHQARWMADCIYHPKMYACRTVFTMTTKEKTQCENIT